MLVNTDFLARPTFPPKKNLLHQSFCRHKHRYSFGHTPLQLLTRFMKILTTSNASHGHIIGRPIYQQYEAGPYASPLLSRASGWTSLSILNTRPRSSRARPVWPGPVSAATGQQQDKRRTRGGQQQDQRRQEEHKTRPQSPATEIRGAASQCSQLYLFSDRSPT